MSTFTLAISCLTISYLPWFTDLTFQVPMQYCSLQHQTLLLWLVSLLLSPVTSTTGWCFSLVIYFIFSSNSMYISIPISQFILSPFPPLVSIHLFSTSVSLFCFSNKIICTIFQDSTYALFKKNFNVQYFKVLIIFNMQYLFFSD